MKLSFFTTLFFINAFLNYPLAATEKSTTQSVTTNGDIPRLNALSVDEAKAILADAGVPPDLLQTIRPYTKKSNIFLLKDPSGFQVVIAKFPGNKARRLREALSYDIAEVAKLNKVVAPVEVIGKNQEVLLASYYQFYTQPVQSLEKLPDKDVLKKLYDAAQTTNGVLELDRVTVDPFSLFDKEAFEKFLVFSFLTFQHDAHDRNILLTLNNKGKLAPIAIDLEYAMTEDPIHYDPTLKHDLFQFPFLLGITSDLPTLNLLNERPSKGIISIVQSWNFSDFEPILIKYKLNTKDIQSFKERVADLKSSFQQNNEKTIIEIFKQLYIKHGRSKGLL
ncbi:MAG: hypothetical protein ABFQ95_01520 [Pseudomonadota bacterium]